MTRRAMFLEALGIPAEWVPRHAPAAEVAAQADALAVVDQPVALAEVAEVIEVAEVAEIAVEVSRIIDAPPARADQPVEIISEHDAEAVAQADLADLTDLAETVEAFDAPDPGRPAAPVPVRPVEQAGREAAIAEMAWPVLADSVAACTACGLCNTRTNTVFGVGDQQAEWMLVGEAPGENEDLQGEPFVGQAGKLLDNMLGALGLARGRNVYIANVLKCRPPGNRNPEPDEVAQCEPYLKRQIALLKPKVIVVLGRFAAQSLLRSTTPIGKLRGTVHTYEGIPVVVTYHPAYLLRTLTDKARAWEDLCLAREVHDRAGAQA